MLTNYKAVNNSRKSECSNINGVKNEFGEIEWNEMEGLKIWREFFMKLYEGDKTCVNGLLVLNKHVAGMEEDECERISTKEVLDELGRAQNGKSPGPDGISYEMISRGGSVLLEQETREEKSRVESRREEKLANVGMSRSLNPGRPHVWSTNRGDCFLALRQSEASHWSCVRSIDAVAYSVVLAQNQ
jgi:hypothetical protein